MATEWKNPSDADVILRASGGKELHAHKLVLSLASPVFRDMFSVPQPSTGSSQTPIVDVDDLPEALRMFLQIIYPIPNPLIDGAETFASVLRLADKYDTKAVFDACNYYLPSIRNNSPLQSYGILCVCGREKEARAVARRAPFASLTCPDSSPLLDLMTTKQYHRLMSFMIARDRRTRQIVGEHQAEIRREGSPFCRDDTAHQLYTGAMTASIQAAFEENPCVRVVEALGIVSSAPVTFSPCKSSCKYNMNELRLHAEGLLKELVKMAENLPWVD